MIRKVRLVLKAIKHLTNTMCGQMGQGAGGWGRQAGSGLREKKIPVNIGITLVAWNML